MSHKSCVLSARLRWGASALALAGTLFTTVALADGATAVSSSQTAAKAQPAQVTSAPAAQASATAPAAPATPAQTAAQQNGIQTITVTAEFRKENLQNTPIAITAVNAAMLEARNQNNVQDITAQAPNVTLKPNGQAFGSSLVAFIRGVGQTDFDYASEPGVGVYVDDVYYATITGNLLDLLDLDRVEVLRGPQGTLAGKNSIGGAIKLFTRKPDGSGGGYVEGTYGSLNRVDVKAGADFTVVPDKVYVRFAGVSRSHDGYVTRLDYTCMHPGSVLPSLNVGMGCKLGTEGGQSYTAGRAALRWVASDNVEVNLSFDMVDDRSEVNPGVLIQTTTNPAAGVPFVPIFFDNNHDGCFNSTAASGCVTPSADGDVPYDNRFVTQGKFAGDPLVHQKYVNYANYIDNGQNPPPISCFLGIPCINLNKFKPVVVPPINFYKSWGIGGTVDWTIADNLSLKWISSYRYYTNTFANDDDESPLAVQELLQTLLHRQWSQELRLSGSFFDKFVEYTLGGFYQEQHGSLRARVDLPYTAFDFVHGPDQTPSKAKAGFVDVTMHPLEKLDVSLGARYSRDEKDYTFHRHNPDGTAITAADACTGPPWAFFTPINCAVAGAGGITLDGLTSRFRSDRKDYRAAISYRWTPDLTTYIQTSTGYKGGGIDARPFVPDQAIAFAPENITAYEAGLKTTLWDRVRLNLAYFYNLYKDIQLTATNCSVLPNGKPSASTTCLLPFNAGDAHVQGFEAETEVHPIDNMELDASLSTLNFKYTRLLSVGTGVTKGMITPYTPKVKWSVGAQYNFDLSGWGTLTPRIDASYQSSTFALPTNAATNHMDGYVVVNARMAWKSEDGTWEASAQGTNIFNKYYYLTINDLSGSAGFVSGQPGMPAEWSVTLKRKF